MDQCKHDEKITLFYMWLSAPQPNIEALTHLIARISARGNKLRADLNEYLEYCEQAVFRTSQIEEEHKNKGQFLSANDAGDITNESHSSKWEQDDSTEAWALAMRKVFERRITIVQRILTARTLPNQQSLRNMHVFKA